MLYFLYFIFLSCESDVIKDLTEKSDFDSFVQIWGGRAKIPKGFQLRLQYNYPKNETVNGGYVILSFTLESCNTKNKYFSRILSYFGQQPEAGNDWNAELEYLKMGFPKYKIPYFHHEEFIKRIGDISPDKKDKWGVLKNIAIFTSIPNDMTENETNILVDVIQEKLDLEVKSKEFLKTQPLSNPSLQQYPIGWRTF